MNLTWRVRLGTVLRFGNRFASLQIIILLKVKFRSLDDSKLFEKPDLHVLKYVDGLKIIFVCLEVISISDLHVCYPFCRL